MSDDEQAAQAGIELYDLAPPTALMPHFTELRLPPERQPRPRYLVPPVPDGHVRVELGDDYYAGAVWARWHCITGDTADSPMAIFDVPAEQVARWEEAQAAYQAMQDEIEALQETRRQMQREAWQAGAPALPPGWVRKEPYQVQP